MTVQFFKYEAQIRSADIQLYSASRNVSNVFIVKWDEIDRIQSNFVSVEDLMRILFTSKSIRLPLSKNDFLAIACTSARYFILHIIWILYFSSLLEYITIVTRTTVYFIKPSYWQSYSPHILVVGSDAHKISRNACKMFYKEKQCLKQL